MVCPGPAPARQTSFERSRAELSERLHRRRPEIEQAVLERALAVSSAGGEAPETQDPLYVEGLRAAVTAAVTYSLEAIERGEGADPPIPPILLAQTRLAARNKVGLDTVLRRYSAGYVLLTDFLVEEAERTGFGGADLQRLLRSQGVLDRVLAAVSEEYGRELAERPAAGKARRAECVRRLLAGEPLDVSGLGYEFDAHHLAAVGAGVGVEGALRAFAAPLDANLLAVACARDGVWAWFGARRPLDPAELVRLVAANWPAGASLALGEPGEGIAGWRLSHRQARAAMSIAMHGTGGAVRYADVALMATVIKDELLVTSLRRLYLEPLERERDGGEAARATLRAYFAAGCNASSAAAALGVRRQTVTSRLRAVEQRIGRPLESCGVELEVALRLSGSAASA